MQGVLSRREGGEARLAWKGVVQKGTRGEWENGRVFASVRGWGNGGFSEGSKGQDCVGLRLGGLDLLRSSCVRAGG